MSDLISRSALLKKFEDDIAEGLIESFDDVIGIVEEQPIAYDKEAVVEQLKEKQTDINGNTSLHYLYSEGYSDAIDYLIDIVKAGGINE